MKANQETQAATLEQALPLKRGRGRPRTRPTPDPDAPKRPRGRPPKNPRPVPVAAQPVPAPREPVIIEARPRTIVMERPMERAPYEPLGAARKMWQSRAREVLLSGAANTGKSRACLEKLHYCADKYPHSRLLIVRRTRHSLTQTAMVTYEQKVLPRGWLSNKRENQGVINWNVGDQQYEYPNGSIIAVGGMDDAQKIMSSEWDMVYIQEAIELSENSWESLTTRLRNHKMPYQQLLADCNPGPPTHWLKMRVDRGGTLMLDSRHEDNPACTPEDLAVLDSLTGVRYLRLRKGIWAAAEGMVYEEWDPQRHVITRERLVNLDIFAAGSRGDYDCQLNRAGCRRVIAGVDWGWTNPGAILVFAVDGDDRMYLVHEVYQTNRDIDWWINQAQALKGRYGIEQFICDPAEPAFIDQFNRSRLPAIKGINNIAPGISHLQARLKVADDNRPRFYVYEHSLPVRDESRAAAYQPVSFQGEILEYVWPKSKDGSPVKEVPVKVNDHAMDAARYACAWMAEGHATGHSLLTELKARVAAREELRKKALDQYW